MAVINGTNSSETLNGTSVADTINGNGGADTINAGDGNDTIDGGTGNDSILGGAGQDSITGNSGNDFIDGGADQDTITVTANQGTDTIAGGETGADADTLVFSGVTSGTGVTVTYSAGESGSYSFSTLGGSGTFSQIESATGSSGNDIFNAAASSGGVNASGGAGLDTMTGGSGADTFDGGTGNDSVVGNAGNDVLTGGLGNDTISGGTGNDSIVAGPAGLPASGTALDLNWTAQGAAGTNLAAGFTQNTGGINVTVGFTNDGNNNPSFLTANDPLYVASGETFSTSSSLFLQGNGDADTSTATLGFSAAAGSGFAGEVVNVRFRINDIDGQTWQDLITITAFDANNNPVTVTITPSANDTVSGGTITGNTTANESPADANGSALISIPGPVSRIVIDYGNNLVGNQFVYLSDVQFEAVSSDNDSVLGGDNNDTIDGGYGNDTLRGEAGADSLIGGNGADSLDGGAGADALNGGLGSDTIDGGADQDAITVSANQGVDSILGGETGTDGDTLSFTGVASGAGVTATWTGTEAGTYAFAGGGSGTFGQIETVSGTAGNDAFNAAASTAGVTVDAGDGNDTVTGGSGADSLQGGAGNDLLSGGQGADVLNGGSGSDTLAGGAGGDAVSGGAGMDYADYSASGGPVNVNLANGAASGGDAAGDTLSGVDGIFGSTFDDTLTGFDGQLVGGPDAYTNLFYGNAGNDLMDGAGGDDQIFGGNDNDTILGGDGNDLVSGDAGNDSLAGGAGNDTLLGGTGQDALFSGAGADSLDGGDDRDTLTLTMGESNGDAVAGGEGGDDFDVLNLVGKYTIAYEPGNGENGTITWRNGDVTAFTGIEQINFVPCFTPGTEIDTIRGPMRVEDVRPGDRVLTRDSGYATVRWVGRRDLSKRDLARNAALQPVTIRAGALGPGVPSRDMTVSPQHRMLLTGAEAELVAGESEVLAAAIHLTCRPGIFRDRRDAVSYVHIMFDRHEVIRADGAWTESFQPGEKVLDDMEAAVRAELFALFPELAEPGGRAGYAAARVALKGYEVRAMFAATEAAA